MVDESRFRYRRDEGAAEGGPRPRSAPSSAATGSDPLAELARLIGDDDPFDDFPGADPARQATGPSRSAPAQRYAPPAAPAYPDPRMAARAPARPLSPPAPAFSDEDDEEDWEATPPSAPAPRPLSQGASAMPVRADAARYGAAPARPVPAAAPAPRPASPSLYAPPPAAPGVRGAAPRPAQPQTAPSFAPAPAAARGVPDAAVRTGYGSLSRSAPPSSVQGHDEDDYDDDYDDLPPARPAGASSHAPQGGYAPARHDRRDDARGDSRSYAGGSARDDDEDEAAYAYSAARRDDDGYDDYDDTYDPEYGEDGYMPPHGEELYDAEPRRRKGRLALILGVSVLGLVVAGVAGVFAYNMAVGKSGVTAAGTPPVIKADSAPAKTATPTPQTADGGQKMIYDRMGANAGNERMVSREEQPVDVTAAARALPQEPSAPPPTPMQATQNLTEPKKVRTVAVRADGSFAQNVPTSSVSAYAATQNPIPAGLPDPNPVTTVPASAPAQTAATTPSPSSAGAYVVQVASQRSEADAMGSWRALQTKYPNLLGNYRATVKKADLGDKGIYYRAQVGPFATRDQANELCQSLRAQGGDCVVNKN
ncbi:SPOR domain-containing protein [Xanthobacter autotrophicus]|uniref:SPOR domain-containing protein n=1 Tax=Xanthobacter TaxID=279 RepID=UPI0024AB4DA7|nr:SPOR domain-containing protein [Xanthobacter autotrophicus]MDI4662842.1 SPOR domain-containing protein [Xanthobacter autotrophicus]